MGFTETGKKIQQAREDKGLTQVEPRPGPGHHPGGTVQNYELGKRRLYLHQIEQIARTLGKDLEYFIGRKRRSAGTSTPARDRVIRRITNMEGDELKDLEDYLDFLAWRRHHG